MFKLSQRSFQRLAGVDEALQETVKLAIQKTKIDFGVICGMRNLKEQEALVAKGASKTMKSKHLEGKAVDLMIAQNPELFVNFSMEVIVPFWHVQFKIVNVMMETFGVVRSAKYCVTWLATVLYLSVVRMVVTILHLIVYFA